MGRRLLLPRGGLGRRPGQAGPRVGAPRCGAGRPAGLQYRAAPRGAAPPPGAARRRGLRPSWRRRRPARGAHAHWPRRGRCHVGGSGASGPREVAAAAAARPCVRASVRAASRVLARSCPGAGMERSRMDLPKGPDTLCFDKDEFMKVRAGARRPGAGQGRLRSASCRVPSAGTSLRFAARLWPRAWRAQPGESAAAESCTLSQKAPKFWPRGFERNVKARVIARPCPWAVGSDCQSPA